MAPLDYTSEAHYNRPFREEYSGHYERSQYLFSSKIVFKKGTAGRGCPEILSQWYNGSASITRWKETQRALSSPLSLASSSFLLAAYSEMLSSVTTYVSIYIASIKGQ